MDHLQRQLRHQPRQRQEGDDARLRRRGRQARPQVTTICHSERSEESISITARRHHSGFPAGLRMTEPFLFMPHRSRSALLLALVGARVLAADAPAPAAPPTDWIDPDTGHRIVQLDDQPGSGTLYFHQSTYTPEGDKLIFNTPAGIAVVDVKAIGTSAGKPTIIVPEASAVNMARRTREVYFSKRGPRGQRP